jgi:hypothetical protein
LFTRVNPAGIRAFAFHSSLPYTTAHEGSKGLKPIFLMAGRIKNNYTFHRYYFDCKDSTSLPEIIRTDAEAFESATAIQQ